MWSACGGALRTCGVGGRARRLFLGQRALAQSYLPVMFQSPCPHLETVGWEKLTLPRLEGRDCWIHRGRALVGSAPSQLLFRTSLQRLEALVRGGGAKPLS